MAAGGRVPSSRGGDRPWRVRIRGPLGRSDSGTGMLVGPPDRRPVDAAGARICSSSWLFRPMRSEGEGHIFSNRCGPVSVQPHVFLGFPRYARSGSSRRTRSRQTLRPGGRDYAGLITSRHPPGGFVGVAECLDLVDFGSAPAVLGKEVVHRHCEVGRARCNGSGARRWRGSGKNHSAGCHATPDRLDDDPSEPDTPATVSVIDHPTVMTPL